jgi:hypothetical protein
MLVLFAHRVEIIACRRLLHCSPFTSLAGIDVAYVFCLLSCSAGSEGALSLPDELRAIISSPRRPPTRSEACVVLDSNAGTLVVLTALPQPVLPHGVDAQGA